MKQSVRKPKNAFFLFRESLSKGRSKNVKASEAAAIWRTMSQQDKLVYFYESRRLMEIFKRQHPEYIFNHTKNLQRKLKKEQSTLDSNLFHDFSLPADHSAHMLTASPSLGDPVFPEISMPMDDIFNTSASLSHPLGSRRVTQSDFVIDGMFPNGDGSGSVIQWSINDPLFGMSWQTFDYCQEPVLLF
ncbi:hypothetical protein EDD86DRAFT_107977 [Gorgonomyces haynaldii]|nr:hypothetical protein EDD86DRAFT_107977 [Gorgonomyces haynaldii]